MLRYGSWSNTPHTWLATMISLLRTLSFRFARLRVTWTLQVMITLKGDMKIHMLCKYCREIHWGPWDSCVRQVQGRNDRSSAMLLHGRRYPCLRKEVDDTARERKWPSVCHWQRTLYWCKARRRNWKRCAAELAQLEEPHRKTYSNNSPLNTPQVHQCKIKQ